MSDGAKIAGAIGAGANLAELVVAVDAGGMAVVEGDADGVVADGVSRFCRYFRLKHREDGGRGCAGGGGRFFACAFVVAGGAGAFVAQESKIEVTAVAVGPGDVNACAGGN